MEDDRLSNYINTYIYVFSDWFVDFYFIFKILYNFYNFFLFLKLIYITSKIEHKYWYTR